MDGITWLSVDLVQGNVPHKPRYAEGESGRVVNIRTLTSQKGLVIIAVTEPKQRLATKRRVESDEEGIANSLERNRGDTLQPTEVV